MTTTIPFTFATLCAEENCRTVYDLRAGQCPLCASPSGLSLARVLDRTREVGTV